MSFKDWPGAGPTPEPEPEGFREDQIEAEKERVRKQREDQAKLNEETAAYYSGESDTKPGTVTTPAQTHDTDYKATHEKAGHDKGTKKS
jgi:hypothetical protein